MKLFLKPFFKTILLSGLIFVLIVILGSRYHWAEKIKFNKNDDVQLKLPLVDKSKPSNSNIVSVSLVTTNENDEKFEPKLMANNNIISSVSLLSKEQVVQKCRQLYQDSKLEGLFLELAIGDCVVSNYNETIKEKAQSTNNRQAQTVKMNAEKACKQKVMNDTNGYTKLEQQLLVGICVSDQLNR